MKWILKRYAAVAVMAFLTGAAHAADKPVLSLDMAKQLLAAASAEAKRVGAPGGAIAIVDDGGYLISAERWDNTFPPASVVSLGKARTSALFRKPTKVFEDAISKGRTAMTALPDTLLTPLQGGLPIIIRGQVAGAIGVSGAASAQQDEDLAMAAIKSLMESMGEK
jgi:uncharacterized protein GlcG (DUF336 family)